MNSLGISQKTKLTFLELRSKIDNGRCKNRTGKFSSKS